MLFGGSRDYGDPDYAARIAKHHFVVLGAWRDFRTPTGNLTLTETVAYLRTLNPDLRIANYMTVSSAADSPTGRSRTCATSFTPRRPPPGRREPRTTGGPTTPTATRSPGNRAASTRSTTARW